MVSEIERRRGNRSRLAKDFTQIAPCGSRFLRIGHIGSGPPLELSLECRVRCILNGSRVYHSLKFLLDVEAGVLLCVNWLGRRFCLRFYFEVFEHSQLINAAFDDDTLLSHA